MTDQEYERLARKYRPWLLAEARRQLSRLGLPWSDAEDHVQGALENVWRLRETVQPTSAYLGAAVRTEVLMAGRRKASRRGEIPPQEPMADIGLYAQDILQGVPVVDQPIAEWLVMGYDSLEIAERLGVPSEGMRTLRRRVARVRDMLKERWKSMDIYDAPVVHHASRDRYIRYPRDGEIQPVAPVYIMDARGRVTGIMDPLTGERVMVGAEKAA